MFWVISRFDLAEQGICDCCNAITCILRCIVNCSKDEPADIVYESDVFYRVHGGT